MRVEDTLQIHELLFAYSEAIDQQRFERLSAVFTADADIDFRQTGGPRAALTDMQAFLTRELSRYRRLQHFISNVRVRFDDEDRALASARSYVLAQHGYLEEGRMRFFQLGGEYEDALTHGAHGWRIRARTLHLRWLDGALPRAPAEAPPQS
ncbi:MAG: nuclear transport factor 2 family protein [Myxococcales bacterium]|nr:nuclear transport factor 2 family protein [Myxococcales bacterium]MCB9628642.1 nuclear transport factor 2 family protein [Sandaracinaceae bacterium]